MRPPVSESGLEYCDWRVNVHDCVFSSYFSRLHTASLVLSSICTATVLLLLTYRILIRKDGVLSLTKGANGASLCVLFELAITTAYHLSVLLLNTSHTSPAGDSSLLPHNGSHTPQTLSPHGTMGDVVAKEVLFGAVVGLTTSPATIYLASMLNGLPQHLFQNLSAVKFRNLIPSERARRITLTVFQVSVFAVTTTLFGLCGYYARAGREETSVGVFQAVAVLSAVFLFLYTSFFAFGAHGMTSVMKSFIETCPHDELMVMNRKKIINNTVIMCLNSYLFAIVLPIIAFYRPFFADYFLTHITGFFALLTVEIGAFLACIGIVLVDVKKAQKEKSSQTNSSVREREREVEISLGSNKTESVVLSDVTVTY